MADTKVQAAGNEAEAIIQKAKGFWAKSSKPIIIVGSILIVLIGGYLGYKYIYKVPREQKADDAILAAESLFSKLAPTQGDLLFEKDSASVEKVLRGGDTTTGKITGLLDILKKYDGTAAANRAHYMIGVIYVHQKQYDKAIKELKAFDPNGSSVTIAYYESLATAYAELKKNDEALSYYMKEAEFNEADEFNTPGIMKKAADFAGHIGKTKEAIDLYKKIKEKYPNRPEAIQVEKDLARLGITE